jgi:hypothetical protein
MTSVIQQATVLAYSFREKKNNTTQRRDQHFALEKK